MQYVVLISPDDSSEVKEYTGYQTINDLVEGWYERCGAFGIGNKMTFLLNARRAYKKKYHTGE